jgi:hypothetical protein
MKDENLLFYLNSSEGQKRHHQKTAGETELKIQLTKVNKKR